MTRTMTKNRTWIGVALVLAFGLAAGCYSDPTKPKYVPPQPDSTQSDSTKTQG
jgi:hypothetical protein